MTFETAVIQKEFAPATPSELSRFVAENAVGPRRALYAAGGRTALNSGYPLSKPGVLVATTELNRTVDFPARDMTITVEAGLRMDDLTCILHAERQQLPIDVPQSNRATLGGVVATNVCGPRRFGYGSLRDYVIGLAAVDASGRLFHTGGRVVKNVAGYDLCKLLVGSMGTLAIITQLTFKLRPLAETAAGLWITMASLEEIESVLDDLGSSQTRPVRVDVLNPSAAQQIAAESRQDIPCSAPVLSIGFEGSQPEVDWQVAKLQDELTSVRIESFIDLRDDKAVRLRDALTEFQTFTDTPLSFQANLTPSRTIEFVQRAAAAGAAVLAHAGNGIVIGQLSDEASSVEQAETILGPLRHLARSCRGNLVVLHCDADWKERLHVCGEAEPSWPLMRKVKMSLDPHNLLNPGCLFPEVSSSEG